MGAAILCAAPISLHHSQVKGLSLSLDSADARVGHLATATSVAGVHRRATRRAVLGSGRLQLLTNEISSNEASRPITWALRNARLSQRSSLT
jgi:hypothetical protein